LELKRFRFRLETLLKIKEYNEKEWELKLAHITRKCISFKKEIGNIRTEKAKTFLTRHLRSEEDMEFLRACEQYISRLEQRAKHIGESLKVEEEEKGKIQEKYLEASRERKTLDRLKGKQAQRHYHKERLEEGKALDDLTTAVYSKKLYL